MTSNLTNLSPSPSGCEEGKFVNMFNTSPCKFINYTDQSIQIALATMCGIGAFILMLSIVSKQLERRSNLSHFDEVFDAHHERDDVEAQLQAAPRR